MVQDWISIYKHVCIIIPEQNFLKVMERVLYFGGQCTN